jgi:hypothetical protein
MKKSLMLFTLLFLTACPPDISEDTLFSETSEICMIGNEGYPCLEGKCTDGSECIHVSHADVSICIDLNISTTEDPTTTE